MMKSYRLPTILALTGLLFTLILSCQKKGDFIDEDLVGSGMHYYPIILNESFIDTISGKDITKLTLEPGQKLSFQLRYRSKDSLQKITLWERYKKDSQKVWEIPYDSSFYSETKNCDTIFISYQIPDKTTDTSSFKFTLIPKVITKKGLRTGKEAELTVE